MRESDAANFERYILQVFPYLQRKQQKDPHRILQRPSGAASVVALHKELQTRVREIHQADAPAEHG